MKKILAFLFFTPFVFSESFNLVQELPEGASATVLQHHEELPVAAAPGMAGQKGSVSRAPVLRVDKDALRYRTAFIDANAVWNLAEKYSKSSQALEENNNFSESADPLSFSISVFPHDEFSVRIESVRPTQFGGFFFSGKLIDEMGFMTMNLSKDGSIRAAVHSTKGVFNISGDRLKGSNNPVLIQEIDMSGISHGDDTVSLGPAESAGMMPLVLQTSTPPTCDDIKAAGEMNDQLTARKTICKARKDSDDENTIDVLVLYTEAARDAQSGSTDAEETQAIRTKIETEVTKTNTALSESYVRSGVAANSRTINLVGMVEVNYSQDRSDMKKDLEKLIYKDGDTNSGGTEIDANGVLDDVHKLRDQYGADLVHLFVKDKKSNVCGVSSVWSSENNWPTPCAGRDNHKPPNSNSCFNHRGYAEQVYNTLGSAGIGHDWRKVFRSTVGFTDSSTNEYPWIYDRWEKSGNAFSVSSLDASCISNHTFAHELGHSMGLFHDRYSQYKDNQNEFNTKTAYRAPNTPVDYSNDEDATQHNNEPYNEVEYPLYPNAYGYTKDVSSPSICWDTIMAGTTYCTDQGASSTLSPPLFSNHNVSVRSNNVSLGNSGTEGVSACQTTIQTNGGTKCFTPSRNNNGGASTSAALNDVWPNIARLSPSETSCENEIELESTRHVEECVCDDSTPAVCKYRNDEKAESALVTCTSAQEGNIREVSHTGKKISLEFIHIVGRQEVINLPITPTHCLPVSDNTIGSSDQLKVVTSNSSGFFHVRLHDPFENNGLRIQMFDNDTNNERTGHIDIVGLGLEAGDVRVSIKQRGRSTSQRPDISRFEADPSGIASGGSSLLSWRIIGDTSFHLREQGSNTDLATTGASHTVSPTSTSTYVLTATNSSGTTTRNVTVTVSDPGHPVISSFRAEPESIASGGSSRLGWNITGETSFHLREQGSNTDLATTGASHTVSPTSTTTYVLTAENANGTTTRNVTVTVTNPQNRPVINSFTASPSSITSGGSSTLRWDISGQDSFHLRRQGSNANLATTGTSHVVRPTSTTTYVLTTTNTNGSTTEDVTVTVTNPSGGSCDGNTRQIILDEATDSCTASNPDLSRTTDLDLQNKNINSLARNDFSGLSSLATLDLSQNQIAGLGASVFYELRSSLTDLSLNSNRISTINASAFSGLSRLKRLDLSSNSLASLSSVFSGLSSLKYLYLNSNDLSSFSGRPFSGLRSLRALSLDSNDLSTLPANLFSGLSSLRYLWLNDNSITTLPDNIFSSLSGLRYLNLSGNTLQRPSASVCNALSRISYVVLSDGQSLNTLCPANYPIGASSAMGASSSTSVSAGGKARSDLQQLFVKLPGKSHFVNRREWNERQSESVVHSFLNVLFFEEKDIVLKLREDGLSMEHIRMITQSAQ